MEKHRGVDFFGCRMSFGLVKNGRQCVKADLENWEGGLRHRERHGAILGLVDWVRAIASEPNMHPIRRRFNLNAVGSYLARRKQREKPARYWQPRKTALAWTSDGGRAARCRPRGERRRGLAQERCGNKSGRRFRR